MIPVIITGLFLSVILFWKSFSRRYISRHIDLNPPRTHDLVRLAEKCHLDLDDEMLSKLELITRFNLSVRYLDYQQEIYQICTKDFSFEVLQSINEVRAWLQNLIETP